MSLFQYFIIIQSDQDLCPLTKLMDSIEYMNWQEQSRKEPDERNAQVDLDLRYWNAIIIENFHIAMIKMKEEEEEEEEEKKKKHAQRYYCE